MGLIHDMCTENCSLELWIWAVTFQLLVLIPKVFPKTLQTAIIKLRPKLNTCLYTKEL